MAIIGTILQEVVKRKKINYDLKQKSNFKQQEITLKKLLKKAKSTEFGKKNQFEFILKSKNFVEVFQQKVPIYNYESLYDQYWYKLIDGKDNICWPGKVKYFALTSGTSAAASKRIPITKDMISSIRKVGIRQVLATKDLQLSPTFYQKNVLMIGGSTSLTKIGNSIIGNSFEGDLSGIMQANLPVWFRRFYKPGRKIAKEKDWNTKLDKMTKLAPKWDIGSIAGVPSWVQILMEKVIAYHKVKNIHEIWPNFSVYCHGGVSFAPYKKSFEELLGKEMNYLETYLASEGFLAFQADKDKDMQLILDNGIFFEFIPFNEKNFSSEGQVLSNPEVFSLNQVKEGIDYAILISTNAGAWRYLIGDTIRFTSIEKYEIIITGRTKHFLSLCGEHLSVDNMTRAIQMVSEEMNMSIKEFTVAGIPYGKLFAHKWYIASDIENVNKDLLKQKLDTALKMLNDDYAVERNSALKDVIIEILPEKFFYDFLKSIGKEGGQNKFPRVIKSLYIQWENFIKEAKK